MWGILWHEAFVRGTLLSNSTYLYPLSISSAEFYLYSSLIVKFGGFRWFRTNFIGPNVQSRLRVLHWFSMLGGNREIFVAAQGNVNFLASKGDWNCFISENNTLFSSGFFFVFPVKIRNCFLQFGDNHKESKPTDINQAVLSENILRYPLPSLWEI